MAGVQVVFNQAAIRSQAIAAGEADLRVRGNRVLSGARRRAPVDKGTLRASITLTFSRGPRGEPVAQIGSNLPYAVWVHEGTGVFGPKGQPIVPRSAQFLRFVPRGGTRPVFARSVQGMPGRPFLLEALEDARD